MSVWKGKVTRLQKKVKYKSLSKGEYKSLSGKGKRKAKSLSEDWTLEMKLKFGPGI